MSSRSIALDRISTQLARLGAGYLQLVLLVVVDGLCMFYFVVMYIVYAIRRTIDPEHVGSWLPTILAYNFGLQLACEFYI